MSQRYSNHVRYYPLHHFVLLPVLSALFAASLVYYFKVPERGYLAGFAIAFFLMLVIVIMMRQHYALVPQNRIVRLEMRLRWFELSGERFAPYEQQLTFGQIAALRFASDSELPALLEKAVAGLSADDIKKQIKDWQADDMRV